MYENKNINYLAKDFGVLKQQLIDYARTYFPNTYNDFTPSSPGTMFIDMAAYVGDILSFYLDNQIQENFLQYAREESNLLTLAYMLGYKPKVTSPAGVELTFYQQVPAIFSGSVYVPDFNYALKLAENASIGSTLTGTPSFLVQDPVDFSFSSSLDPTVVSVFQITSNQPSKYLLTKTRKAISSTISTTTFTFGSPQQFSTVEINDTNIIKVLSIIDNQGNEWYEVDYLGQDTIYESLQNVNTNDPNFSSDQSQVPYLLQLKTVPRRFVTRFKDSNTLQIQFGAGTVADFDELITPNPDNVGIGLPFEQDKLNVAYSPNNFMFTDSYGIAPSNTTLTVRYLTGGGVSANVQVGALNTLSNGNLSFLQSNLNAVTAQDIFDSFAVDNLVAASGGGDGDSIEEIRQNSMAQFSSQLRTVTQDDYLVRALSLPSQYGQIAKVYTTSQKASEVTANEKITSLDLYVLAYNNQKQLEIPSLALKNNLKTYLSQYRMINDTVSIKNGFIINIGVNFDIIVLPNFNSNEVIAACIVALQAYFNIDNWQINQPIILRDLFNILDRVQGVQTVKNIEIVNKAGTNLGYSQYGYDMQGATVNNIVYPSIDPSIFEVKYLNNDIIGRVITF
jgi:hypothetical protein